MNKSPRVHTPAFKAQVALAALKGDRTLSEIAAHYQVHVKLVQAWKKQMMEQAATVFVASVKPVSRKEPEANQAELFEQIGRLKMELEWVKKKLPPSCEWKRQQIEPNHDELSIRRQCELLGLNRSSFYLEPASASDMDLALMERLDRLHRDHPFLGSRKLTRLLGSPGEGVNRKRVQRLIRVMGLECLFPRPKCTLTSRCHKTYPYLLKGVMIDRPEQVWSADITYVPMPSGFMYLVATIDWFSRLVVSWRLSNTLEGSFCQAMREESLTRGCPAIFNTDQGVQFTATAWTSRLEAAGIQVSMDGVGRCHDNIFVERLWRSVKYEELYPKRYATVPELEAGLRAYFAFYNEVRPHQSLGYRTSARVVEREFSEVVFGLANGVHFTVFRRNVDQIAAVVLDMMMPVKDGPAVMAELRAVRSDVAILAASGLRPSGRVAEAVANGAAGFLQKPFSDEELHRAVAAAIARGR